LLVLHLQQPAYIFDKDWEITLILMALKMLVTHYFINWGEKMVSVQLSSFLYAIFQFPIVAMQYL